MIIFIIFIIIVIVIIIIIIIIIIIKFLCPFFIKNTTINKLQELFVYK